MAFTKEMVDEWRAKRFPEIHAAIAKHDALMTEWDNATEQLINFYRQESLSWEKIKGVLEIIADDLYVYLKDQEEGQTKKD